MNRITEDFKKNLLSRYSQKEELNQPLAYSQPAQIPNSEQKFMQLFQTINKPVNNQSSSPVKSQDREKKFAETLHEYSYNRSFIESIINTNDDDLSLSYESTPHFTQPLIHNQKAPFEESIRDITTAFQGQQYRLQVELYNDHYMDLDVFSTVLSSLGRKNKVLQAKLQAKGKAIIREPSSKSPVREIHTDTAELQQQQREQSQRMKKIDLILVELIREKKRKNYVADYEATMEMKLMELLEFILQDQPQYMGLDPSDKTRLVLKNLQHFQGKTIEGQSKINLLRIFFEEFTALKKQKEQFHTPMKKLENREKLSSKTRQPTKRSNKNEHFTQQNSHTQKKSIKSKSNQAEKRDQWIGNL